MTKRLLALILFAHACLFAEVEVGIDRFFSEHFAESLRGKKVGLITNHTGVNRHLASTIEIFQQNARDFQLVALFAPEHGLRGNHGAGESVPDLPASTPVYSLHGSTRRPTEAMLKGIDVLVYDIQDIGCRSYTYATTLFYAMEEAAKKKIEVIVLDRPNPLGGLLVDGPMLEEKWRSFIGYLNIPYCHGMTIGELARYFNEEYHIGCKLTVVQMSGWSRQMAFSDTQLPWVPTSPNIPEADSPFFYATTGLLGELELVDIGIGYTLPFKVVGAPWIRAHELAAKLNKQNLAYVSFLPFCYRPLSGKCKGKDCEGVLLYIKDKSAYRPHFVCSLLLGALKALYPEEMQAALSTLSASHKQMFCKASGSERPLTLLAQEKYVTWKLIELQKEEREAFLEKRKKYLLY